MISKERIFYLLSLESRHIDDFIERQYTADDIGEFISFAIKIRMQGSNSSEVPRCKDLRAIALAT